MAATLRVIGNVSYLKARRPATFGEKDVRGLSRNSTISNRDEINQYEEESGFGGSSQCPSCDGYCGSDINTKAMKQMTPHPVTRFGVHICENIVSRDSRFCSNPNESCLWFVQPMVISYIFHFICFNAKNPELKRVLPDSHTCFKNKFLTF